MTTTHPDITLDTPIKFLTATGGGAHSKHPRYPLGRKLTVRGPLVLCEKGYHWTTPRHWREWVDAQCWLVEPSGETMTAEDKSCSRSLRLITQLSTWTDRSARLLACEIAETVLHLTTDPRPAETIAVARRFARGQATEDERLAASRAGSWAASRAASAGESTGSVKASRAASWAASAEASTHHTQLFLETIQGLRNQE